MISLTIELYLILFAIITFFDHSPGHVPFGLILNIQMYYKKTRLEIDFASTSISVTDSPFDGLR